MADLHMCTTCLWMLVCRTVWMTAKFAYFKQDVINIKENLVKTNTSNWIFNENLVTKNMSCQKRYETNPEACI